MRRRREGVLDIRIDSPNRMNENYYSANQQHFRISSGHRPITYIHSVFTKALNHICVRVLLHNRSNRAEFKLAALSHCKIIYKSSGPCEHVSMPMTVLYMCVYVFRVRILLALLRQFGRDHELESSYNITVYI